MAFEENYTVRIYGACSITIVQPLIKQHPKIIDVHDTITIQVVAGSTARVGMNQIILGFTEFISVFRT